MALSTMNVTGQDLLADGHREVRFATSPPMSANLLGFVVGDFDFIERNYPSLDRSATIPVRVYASKDLAELGHYTLKCAGSALQYMQEYFDMSYPLPKLGKRYRHRHLSA